jgi:hypothetical protein
MYYFYLIIMFAVITIIIFLYTRHVIQKDITGPIIKLKKSLKLN